jgi:plasmid maintenance system killer protein
MDMAHKLSITVSDEMKKRLDDYRFGNRIDKFQSAVLDVLDAGLRIIEESARNEIINVSPSNDAEPVILQENNHQSA